MPLVRNSHFCFNEKYTRVEVHLFHVERSFLGPTEKRLRNSTRLTNKCVRMANVQLRQKKKKEKKSPE